MANMGYCRFQNTARDLDDCYDHMDDEDLSSEEQAARKRLIDLCCSIAADYEDEDEESE